MGMLIERKMPLLTLLHLLPVFHFTVPSASMPRLPRELHKPPLESKLAISTMASPTDWLHARLWVQGRVNKFNRKAYDPPSDAENGDGECHFS